MLLLLLQQAGFAQFFGACMCEMLLLVEVGQLARNYNGLGEPLAAVVR